MPWAVVTGGSRGIGAATCRRLAEDGYHIAFTWHANSAAADRVAEDVRTIGRECLSHQLDLGDPEAAGEWAQQLADTRQPQVLVTNAAETFHGGVADHSPEVVRRILEVNLVSTIELIRRFAPALAGTGQGAVVAVASMNALRGSADSLAYSASKAAILGLTRCLAVELSPAVRVNAVVPGVIDTEMNAAPLADPEVLAVVERSLPLARVGTADEVGRLIAWLASPAASYVTGSTLAADGGGLVAFPVH